MDTYTYVANYGNKILSRGYDENGSRFNRKDDFYPVLFSNAKKTAKQNTEWKDLYGVPLYEINPGSIRDCKDFIEQYKDVHGFEIFGMTNWVTQYISEEYPGTIKFSIEHTRVNIIDIETAVEDGFPDVDKANEEVLIITLYDSILKSYVVYAAKDFDVDGVLLDKYGIGAKYVRKSLHVDEYHMLKTFVTDWQSLCPDVVSGWNSQFFDIPYLVNRINRVLGDSFANKLSPWNLVRDRRVKINNDEQLVYDIIGVNQLDYIDLMKKYTYGGRESWKLDNIANDELGRKKLEYDGTFKEHYTKDWDHFCMYNIIDVSLVKAFEDKMKLIELALTIAYDSKIVPDEVFSQIRSWDSLIYNELKKKKIVIPNAKRNQRDQFEGAYVKEPIIGKHKWVVSFDLQSLYPHLMLWANISPETMVDYRKNVTVDKLLDRATENTDLVEQNLAMTANGVCYHRKAPGFVPDLVGRIYNERSVFKKQMLKIEQDYADTKNPALVSEISRLNNLQLARKIQINSVYGAMGSPYFRYYDLRMAEGITTSGQLAIRWVSRALNEFLNKACKTKDVDYCIYNDTDSCYFTLAKVVEQTQGSKSTEDIVKFVDKFAGEVMQKVINKSYQELADYMNAYQQKLIMKREVIADVAIFVAKKRYAMSVHNSEGVQYKEPKIKVTGLELVRSSTPAVVRTTLKAGVKQVLYGTQSSVQKFIAEYQAKYLIEPIEAIAFPRGVNGLKQYSGSPIYTKGCPIHVRGALLYNHYIKKLGLEGKYEFIKEGSKMKFVYLRLPNKFHENVIGFIDKLPLEFGLTDYVDKDTMFQKSFVESMQTMLDPLGWSAEERSSLEDFFN
jgi:DNA polymerase elongation subunit (family B)